LIIKYTFILHIIMLIFTVVFDITFDKKAAQIFFHFSRFALKLKETFHVYLTHSNRFFILFHNCIINAENICLIIMYDNKPIVFNSISRKTRIFYFYFYINILNLYFI
jgi:hypothetical protein